METHNPMNYDKGPHKYDPQHVIKGMKSNDEWPELFEDQGIQDETGADLTRIVSALTMHQYINEKQANALFEAIKIGTQAGKYHLMKDVVKVLNKILKIHGAQIKDIADLDEFKAKLRKAEELQIN